MNTDLTRFIRSTWHLLTDLPGWSDPPLKLRLRRLFPIVLPVVASVLLAGWSVFVHRPAIERVRTNYAPLIALEDETRELRAAFSEPEAIELAERAREAAELMLPSSEAAPEYLQSVREITGRHKWVGAFKDYEPVSGRNPDDDSILFVPAAGKMMPERSNRKPFASLLELLDEFTASKTRIDLTRLVVRVDEQTGPVVEVNFQIASHRHHEKAAQ